MRDELNNLELIALNKYCELIYNDNNETTHTELMNISEILVDMIKSSLETLNSSIDSITRNYGSTNNNQYNLARKQLLKMKESSMFAKKTLSKTAHLLENSEYTSTSIYNTQRERLEGIISNYTSTTNYGNKMIKEYYEIIKNL